MQQLQKPSPKPVKIQPKLQVNQPGDRFEQEADAMADSVMRMPDAHQQQAAPNNPVTGIIGRSVQRKCAHCEEEEKKKLMRKTEAGNSGMSVSSSFASSLYASKGGGSPLPQGTKGFMENAFGIDFSDVKIHTGAQASEMNKAINAKAFTYGNDIYFNEGTYAADSGPGKKLLAHELTHVVQQTGTQDFPAIQRAVGARSSCAANTNNSPADPLDVLRQANDRAVLMALGASHLLFSDSLFMQDATFGSSGILNMYRRRFGDPATVRSRRSPTRFRNRFTRSMHDTLLRAQASEMQFLSARCKQISEFLDGAIHFICTGTRRTTIGSCTHRCGTDAGLAACSERHGREIAVCPNFWNGFPSIDEKAIGMIHETLHMIFHFDRDFDTTPFADTDSRRRIEPECFASLVADIYGLAPVDPSCPQLAI